MKYVFANDFPLSIALGGKEDQLRFVAGVASEVFETILNINDLTTADDNFVLHVFGDTPHFYHTAQFLEGLGKKFKLIVSPNFYRRSPSHYFLSRITRIFGPNWWSERRFLYYRADIIIVNSEFEKKYLLKIFGKDLSTKIRVIYNTFDLDFTQLQKPQKVEKYFCTVAHFNKRKNIFNLIQAASEVYKITGIKTYLIGGKRFASVKEVRRFEKELEIADGVVWVGPVSREAAHQWIGNSYCHVMPSFIESPGLTNIQAYKLNVQMVCGEFPILREYFSEYPHYCGFDAKSIKQAMLYSIENPKTKSIEANNWTRKNVEQCYQAVFKELK